MKDCAPPLACRQQSSMAYEEQHYRNWDVEQIKIQSLEPSAVLPTAKMAKHVGLAT